MDVMKLFLTVTFLGLLAAGDPFSSDRSEITTSTICQVAKDPARFDNKLVRVRATIVGNFEISSIADSDNAECGRLWFTYPGSGPAAFVSMSSLSPTVPRPAVVLRHDGQFRRFQKLLDAQMYPRTRNIGCMDCKRYEVSATMIGLVEFAGRGKSFGHMNSFPAQFVLSRIESSSGTDLASRYAAADFSTEPVRFPTGYLSGTLVGPTGGPIADGDLTVYSATDPEAHLDDDMATTDRKGCFKFSIPPGDYVIGFNTFWPPSREFPFAPTYYPSAHRRSDAKIISVADRQHIRNLVMRLPEPLVSRTISVKVLWPDGKPVADANVWLSQLDDPTAVVGTAVSHTRDDGTFDLVGLEGIDYILHADKYTGLAQVSCAQTMLIRGADSVLRRIELSLTRKDYKTCSGLDLEVPTDANPPN